MISDKGVLGMIAGVATTVILQPFENLKVALMIPPKDMALKNNFLLDMQVAVRYIAQRDGLQGFYKGTVAGTAKAAIGCYAFFSLLRKFEQKNKNAFHDFIISSFARISSTILTNPLSIIETRFELADSKPYKNVRGALQEIYQKEGMRGFLRGGLATCLKDGSFAGFYYMGYEKLKSQGVNKMTAGMLSGMIGTAITHPFELIRTRIQTAGLRQKVIDKNLIIKEIKILLISGQWMKGLTPRLFKKPFANTITFLMFELLEERNKEPMP